jgi:cellulose synthase/poly-beta-1,6-N-acetylglucosamine synthase-like glycosyltransferase
MLLGTSCCISGTGFLMHTDIVQKFGGWPQHLLVEDIQFTAENILAGEKIGYCESAVLYDEQPEKFLQSWAQRMRWVRGHMQITAHYGIKLLHGLFSRNVISCYDFLMTLFPAMLLSIGGVVCTFARFVLMMMQEIYLPAVQLLASDAATGYGFMLLIGLLTLLTEWKQIHTGPVRKIILLLAFPLFMATYIPIAVACLFKKVEWKPIHHTVAIGLSDISNTKEKLK